MKVLAGTVVLALALGLSHAATCTYTVREKKCVLFGLICYYVDKTVSENCVHGGWTDWVEVSRTACSKECDTGSLVVTQTRSCTNPTPVGRGTPCSGPSSQTVSSVCNTQPCPVDGGWTNWTVWEDVTLCTALCGGGTLVQTHSRTCTNPAPMYGGKSCSGEARENRTVECNVDDCGVRCPTGENTYIAATDSHYFYRCVEGDASTKTKAVAQECGENLVWNQALLTCTLKTAPATCTNGALRADPADCRYFLQCINGQEVRMACSPGTKFSNQNQYCDFEANVVC